MIQNLQQLEQLKEELLKKENSSEIVTKFRSVNRGVKLNNNYKFYLWEDLISKKVPLRILKTRVIELNMIINALEPGINSNVCFKHTTAEKVIDFTWQDCKEFIIQAIKYRRKLPEHKDLVKRLAEAERRVDQRAIAELNKLVGS